MCSAFDVLKCPGCRSGRYRIFRSASGKDEFSQLTHRPIVDVFFSDTINKNDLNRSIFYKIIALDQRQNQSEFSNIFELIKPDIIPPSIPVLTETKATKEGIFLQWINSNSTDVEKHEVYRKLNNDTAWQKIGELPLEKSKTTSSYTDSESSSIQIARYKIVAVDKNGNISDASVSVAIKALKTSKGKTLKKLQKRTDLENGLVTISWESPEKEVMHYKIYRKSKTSNYTLYQTIEGTKNSFEDYKLKLGDFFAYRIKVIYADGDISGFSKEINIQF